MIKFKKFTNRYQPVYVHFRNNIKNVSEQYWMGKNDHENHFDNFSDDSQHTNPDEIHHVKGFEHLEHLSKIPSRAHENSISKYSGEGGIKLNKSLIKRAGEKNLNKDKFQYYYDDGHDMSNKIVDKHLSQTIRSNISKKDMHVFSGISFTPEYRSKKNFSLPAYTSTSLSKHVAMNFGSTPTHSEHINMIKKGKR